MKTKYIGFERTKIYMFQYRLLIIKLFLPQCKMIFFDKSLRRDMLSKTVHKFMCSSVLVFSEKIVPVVFKTVILLFLLHALDLPDNEESF